MKRGPSTKLPVASVNTYVLSFIYFREKRSSCMFLDYQYRICFRMVFYINRGIMLKGRRKISQAVVFKYQRLLAIKKEKFLELEGIREGCNNNK